LDALSVRAVVSVGETQPPAPVDGQSFIVGAGATGDWAGHDGEIALALNGGWAFQAPRAGWRVFSEADHAEYLCDAVTWQVQAIACSAGAAVTRAEILEFDQPLSGGVVTTAVSIPDKASVLGVSARVVAEITGATGFSLGVSGSADRYGAGFGTGLNSFAEGLTGQPQTYYGATPLEVTALGGSFTGGTLRLAVHYQKIAPPRAV
ncbi:MAG: DUF2793 domain-containing protein, partial [Pseudomonadota bacterium]